MTPTIPGATEETRHHAVSIKLSIDLMRFLESYRTQDRRQLQEGEVMTAIGRVIAHRAETDTRVRAWCGHVSVAALALFDVRQEEKKQK